MRPAGYLANGLARPRIYSFAGAGFLKAPI